MGLGFVEALIIGSYVWSTTLAGWLYRQIHNHARTRINKLEKRVRRLEGHPEDEE